MNELLNYNPRFNDITIRHILNVNGLVLLDIKSIVPNWNGANYSNKLKIKRNFVLPNNQSFFWQNDNQICVGFKIDTIIGRIEIPMISMKNIRIKKRISLDLNNYFPKFKKREKLNKLLILINYTQLPIEIIEYIMCFY